MGPGTSLPRLVKLSLAKCPKFRNFDKVFLEHFDSFFPGWQGVSVGGGGGKESSGGKE